MLFYHINKAIESRKDQTLTIDDSSTPTEIGEILSRFRKGLMSSATVRSDGDLIINEDPAFNSSKMSG